MNKSSVFFAVIAAIMYIIIIAAIFYKIGLMGNDREWLNDPDNYDMVLEEDVSLCAIKDTTGIKGTSHGSSFLMMGSMSGSINSTYEYRYMMGNDDEGYKTYTVPASQSVLIPLKAGESPHMETYHAILNKDESRFDFHKGQIDDLIPKEYKFYIPKENISAFDSYQIDLE